MSFIVQKNHLRYNVEGFETLKWLSHKCKNLYNSANYLIKSYFEKTGKYLNYKMLFSQIKNHITYTQLHSDNAQLTLRSLRQNYSWEDFFPDSIFYVGDGKFDNETPSDSDDVGFETYSIVILLAAYFIFRKIKNIDN